YTFFTGDVIIAPEFIKFLEKITKTSKNLFIVIGNMDYYSGNRNSPVFQELRLLFPDGDNITVGLTHGAQIQPRGDHSQLEQLAIEKGDNILISGHTHKEEIFLTDKGILLLNPGSVTGAWSFVASGIPSFVVLKIKEDTKEINLSLFHLDKKTQKISELKSYFIFKKNRVLARF
ncbi:MAG: YfcE family phosphodiesterase, partial [Promethearchaeota archaeon]